MQLTKVKNVYYILFGLLFFEAKMFIGERSPLPEITDEKVILRTTAKLRNLLERNNGMLITNLSKKLKISTNTVKQLAQESGFLIENDMVFNEKVKQQ